MPLTNVLPLAIYGVIVGLGLGHPFVASGVVHDQLGRVSQQEVRYPDELMDRASPASRAPQIKRLTAARPSQIELADPSLAATAAKRKQLTYLVRCAMPPEVELYAQFGSERFTFPGSIGLAPHWLTQAMTPSEERWVSACLLAHVNYFGKHVRISIRATPPPVPELEASDDERKTYTIAEGGFFGNLFLPQPVAYTCLGARMPAQAVDPILLDRVCTQATGATTADNNPITRCRFVVTGRCEEASSFTVDGIFYREVIFTYLKPTRPSPGRTEEHKR
jgi:hypothetical protein